VGTGRRVDDPLYKIRGLLRHGHEHLSDKKTARLNAGLEAGDPSWEVTVAWQCYQKLRAAYTATNPAEGRRIAEQVINSFPSCPLPEVARLGRTLRAWRAQVLAYFATKGVSNGGTEAVNLLIEKTRRLAHGFRNFANCGVQSQPHDMRGASPVRLRQSRQSFVGSSCRPLHLRTEPRAQQQRKGDGRFAWAITHGVDALEDVPMLGHRCDNPLCQMVGPRHVEASSAWRNRQEWVMRRHTIGGPLRDRRGARGRALAVRDALRVDPSGATAAAVMRSGLSADMAQMPLWDCVP